MHVCIYLWYLPLAIKRNNQNYFHWVPILIMTKNIMLIDKWMVTLIIILWLSFELFWICRWIKVFIFFACKKDVLVLTFLLLQSNFDHVFGPKREIPSPCICFCTSMLKPHISDSSPLLFKLGEVNFDYLPWKGGLKN